MRKSILLCFIALPITLNSCLENEDPGPIQQQEKEYSLDDFDRLEAGDALNITVEQGSAYSIKVKGDRRNIDDLELKTVGTTLQMRFDDHGHYDNRQYTTYITITMPALNGVSFSGAVDAKISGVANNFDAVLSGASELHAFDFETETLTIEASGASEAQIFAKQQLNANASGASDIRYRGNPALNVSVSGASTIKAE